MKKLGVLIVTFGLMVSGCSEDVDLSVSADVEAEEVSVISNKTDKEIATEIVMTYYNYAMEVHQTVYNDKFTESNKQYYIDLTTDFLNYINEIDPYSMDIQDRVLEEYLWEFDYSATSYADNTLNYLTHTDNSVYRNMAEDYYYDVLADMNLVNSILEPTK